MAETRQLWHGRIAVNGKQLGSVEHVDPQTVVDLVTVMLVAIFLPGDVEEMSVWIGREDPAF